MTLRFFYSSTQQNVYVTHSTALFLKIYLEYKMVVFYHEREKTFEYVIYCLHFILSPFVVFVCARVCVWLCVHVCIATVKFNCTMNSHSLRVPFRFALRAMGEKFFEYTECGWVLFGRCLAFCVLYKRRWILAYGFCAASAAVLLLMLLLLLSLISKWRGNRWKNNKKQNTSDMKENTNEK